jgi:hypothetical protein
MQMRSEAASTALKYKTKNIKTEKSERNEHQAQRRKKIWRWFATDPNAQHEPQSD